MTAMLYPKVAHAVPEFEQPPVPEPNAPVKDTLASVTQYSTTVLVVVE